MRNLLSAASVVVLASMISPAANAGPISVGSTLSLLGVDTYTPTSVSFVGLAGIGAGSGAFAALAPCTNCVTVHDFDTSSVDFVVYDDPDTSLTLNSVAFNYDPSSTSLTVTGNGTATLTGYDPTPGSFTLTTQGPNDTAVTWSSTTVAGAIDVSEPGSLALLGVSLIGLGMVGANRKRIRRNGLGMMMA